MNGFAVADESTEYVSGKQREIDRADPQRRNLPSCFLHRQKDREPFRLKKGRNKLLMS
jgi:hypothetical protein